MTVNPVVVPLSANPTGPVWMANPTVEQVTLVNRDTANRVYIGNNPSIYVGSPNAVPLDPNASICYPGNKPIYAVATAGTAPLLIVPGAVAYSPGGLAIVGNVNATISGNVNIAGQSVALDVSAANVNVNGVGGSFPPGANTLLFSNTNVNVPGAGSATTGVLDCLNYQSYDLAFNAHCANQANNGAPLVTEIILSWYSDAAGTNLVFQEQWWTWLTNSTATAVTAFGTGPHHARYFKVTLANISAGFAFTIDSIFVYGTQRPQTGSTWRQNAPAGGSMNSGLTMLLPSGGTPAPGLDNELCNLIDNATTAANATVWQPYALCPGPFWVRYRTETALANDFIIASASSLLNGSVIAGTGAQGTLWEAGNTAATNYTANLISPRSPMYSVIHATATAPTVSITIIAQGGSV